MTTPDQTITVDQRIQEYFSHVVGSVTTAMILVGDRLGLYRTLAERGPVTPEQLAEVTGNHERYLREWLSQQAAVGILAYDAGPGTFALAEGWAPILTEESMTAMTLLPAGMFGDAEQLVQAFRTGVGIPWGDHDPVTFEQTERFWGGQYRSALLAEWIPALDGIEEKLTAGATVADIGTGHGAPLIMLAQAFPASRFFGFDAHEPSIEVARERARDAGAADRVRFDVGYCHGYPGHDYDMVTYFDAFHDLGDPVGAAAFARNTLTDGGSLVLIEPRAEDDLATNIAANPGAPLGYAASTFLCTPNSLSQPVGLALGSQAGEATLRSILTEAGFTRVQRVAESQFNMVLQARV